MVAGSPTIGRRIGARPGRLAHGPGSGPTTGRRPGDRDKAASAFTRSAFRAFFGALDVRQPGTARRGRPPGGRGRLRRGMLGRVPLGDQVGPTIGQVFGQRSGLVAAVGRRPWGRSDRPGFGRRAFPPLGPFPRSRGGRGIPSAPPGGRRHQRIGNTSFSHVFGSRPSSFPLGAFQGHPQRLTDLVEALERQHAFAGQEPLQDRHIDAGSLADRVGGQAAAGDLRPQDLGRGVRARASGCGSVLGLAFLAIGSSPKKAPRHLAGRGASDSQHNRPRHNRSSASRSSASRSR